MIFPPHKHDVLKNKKPPKGSHNTPNGTVSQQQATRCLTKYYFFFWGGVGVGAVKNDFPTP